MCKNVSFVLFSPFDVLSDQTCGYLSMVPCRSAGQLGVCIGFHSSYPLNKGSKQAPGKTKDAPFAHCERSQPTHLLIMRMRSLQRPQAAKTLKALVHISVNCLYTHICAQRQNMGANTTEGTSKTTTSTTAGGSHGQPPTPARPTHTRRPPTAHPNTCYPPLVTDGPPSCRPHTRRGCLRHRPPAVVPPAANAAATRGGSRQGRGRRWVTGAPAGSGGGAGAGTGRGGGSQRRQRRPAAGSAAGHGGGDRRRRQKERQEATGGQGGGLQRGWRPASSSAVSGEGGDHWRARRSAAGAGDRGSGGG